MRVIVGLGNPGPDYADTRHNAGFLLADALANRWRLSRFRRAPRALVAGGRVGDCPVTLLKPQTYMNLSGLGLEPLLAQPEFDPAHHLLLLVDDSALPLGTFRLRARGSSGGHHGLESVEQVLGSRVYARLRIGIGPVPEDVADLTDFVLAPFTSTEAETLRELLPQMGDAVECWVAEGIQQAMNRFNRKKLD
ncbi:MAG: aminoacyl-tRNA hydrolase [Gemmatimonadetes bacterium]|nr:aminoacyl-tRNA hydrolase [Gemmatimonadota bacterium]